MTENLSPCRSNVNSSLLLGLLAPSALIAAREEGAEAGRRDADAAASLLRMEEKEERNRLSRRLEQAGEEADEYEASINRERNKVDELERLVKELRRNLKGDDSDEFYEDEDNNAVLGMIKYRDEAEKLRKKLAERTEELTSSRQENLVGKNINSARYKP